MLSGKCKEDFDSWAIGAYGYCDEKYLGLPVVLEFLEMHFDIEWLPLHSVGKLREQERIQACLQAIEVSNKMYNAK